MACHLWCHLITWAGSRGHWRPLCFLIAVRGRRCPPHPHCPCQLLHLQEWGSPASPLHGRVQGLPMRFSQKGCRPFLSHGGLRPDQVSVPGLPRLLGPFSPARLCFVLSKACQDVQVMSPSQPVPSPDSPKALLPLKPQGFQERPRKRRHLRRRGLLRLASEMSAWKGGWHHPFLEEAQGHHRSKRQQPWSPV